MSKLRHLAGLAKIPATLDYVDEFVKDTDRKLVVFAHHIDVQEILYESIKETHGDKIPIFVSRRILTPRCVMRFR